MFVEAIEEILKGHCSPSAVRAIESGGAATSLWNAIADAGFLDLLTSETKGGAGLTLCEVFPIFGMIGRYAVPVPIAQSIAARVFLADITAIPKAMLTIAPACRREGNSLVCPLVPFGTIADYVLTSEGTALMLLRCADATRTTTGVHRSLTASLRWEQTDPYEFLPDAGSGLSAYGAALHASLLAGAMERTLELTLQYANDRSQFGKSIGKFQAIQQQISVMAEQVAAASIAAETAFHSDTYVPTLLTSAIAKSRTSEATMQVTSIAHAVHGAIGITEEYDLQLFTRRLHEWRMAHGSEAYWNQVVGKYALESKHSSMADFVRNVKYPIIN